MPTDKIRRLVLLVLLLMVVTSCSKSSAAAPDKPTGPPDGMVTFTWTAPASDSCYTYYPYGGDFSSSDRVFLNTPHWAPGYNTGTPGMNPDGDVKPDGSGGHYSITVKVPTSIQFDGTLERWEVGGADACAALGGALTGSGFSAQGQNCPGPAVPLQDLGLWQYTVIYYEPPCGVYATPGAAQAAQ